MSDTNLRKALIRLAHSNPDLQPHLVPLLSKQARHIGETYPKVYGHAHDQGIVLWMTTQVAWGGADPAAAKKRIDESVSFIRAAMNGGLLKVTYPMGLTLGSLSVNGTQWAGVLYFTYSLYRNSGDRTVIPKYEAALKHVGIPIEKPKH